MSIPRFVRVSLVSLLVMSLVQPCRVLAADDDDDDDDDSNSYAGVLISPEGVLRKALTPDPRGQLMRERVQAAWAAMPTEVRSFSKLRKISLVRLEKAIVSKNGVPTEEMKYLAGLQRLRYVFLYPEEQDIVIAGPAEGWVADPAGRVRGINTRRPTLQLQDLVVALRAFPAGTKGTRLISCSIDPTREGLAAMQAFLRSVGAYATPNDTEFIVNGLRMSLGLQTISINGVSPNTHFARIMVEADYRMKLIGIGLEKPPVRMVSFVDKANPAQISRNALFRWYFVPAYQCVRASEDRQAMELVGDGVKLVGEDELVAAGGQRTATVKGDRASQMFIMSFTKKYPDLAARSPVYAELRNVIDLSVAAAFIEQEDYYGKAGWKMAFFGDEESYAVERQPAPKQVASAVAAVWKGNRLTTPIGGGVHIEARQALAEGNRLDDEEGRVAKLRQQTKLPAGRWWWD